LRPEGDEFVRRDNGCITIAIQNAPLLGKSRSSFVETTGV